MFQIVILLEGDYKRVKSGGLGADRQCYAVFFSIGALYAVCLAWYAAKHANIVHAFTLVLFNTFFVVYGSVQGV